MLPTDLLGDWVLRRTVDDRRAGASGTVTGTTTLTLVALDEVRWDESGTMHFGGRVTPVSRTLSVRRVDKRWTVHFADGRVFHPWVWGTAVEHPCAPDDYTGVLDGAAERWTVRWEAHGPAKDYRLDSVLERRTATAD
ncbi:hypothetical protein C1N91_01250 [Curtobacterium sp. SGAir0471]|uniref:DUF6314 family protein n=1 Tax=Curtobacterium sp. SGAir0471 TaxID=2070337 RepID=UPI0010CCF43B|nr:DUF6314 family protein [Curtobacterium sp. SGAir0471]QCR42372.1 hypothetical protein C1N91_01250 [Curtobacterium sp. SGAir0471]